MVVVSSGYWNGALRLGTFDATGVSGVSRVRAFNIAPLGRMTTAKAVNGLSIDLFSTNVAVKESPALKDEPLSSTSA